MDSLESFFMSRRLVHPYGGRLNLMDILRFYFQPGSKAPESLKPFLNGGREKKKRIFILLDGLGMAFQDLFPENGFLVNSFKLALPTIYPSTTACVLTSIATLEYPHRHGVTGWYTRIPEKKINVTLLPWKEQITDTDIGDEDLTIDEVITAPSLFKSAGSRVRLLCPSEYSGGKYNLWAHPSGKISSYSGVEDCFQKAEEWVRYTDDREILYIYIPDVDSKAHYYGTHSSEVIKKINLIDDELGKFAGNVEKEALLLITADHGLIDIPLERQLVLNKMENVWPLLDCYPTGEAVNPIFHVREGSENEFREKFEKEYQGSFRLLSPADLIEFGLLNGCRIDSDLITRFGTFVGIALEPAAVRLDFPKRKTKKMIAFHGGLRPEEMVIPLFIT